VIYVESISNPLMGVSDLAAAAEFAKAHELVSMVDNTFASPVNFRPAEWGFDISLHSCTKYMNGHSDLVAGAVIGGAESVERVRHKLNLLGASLDPHACFLLHRGVKTLGVRMRQQNENALAIATFLEKHAAVARVNYPGLESNPEHERAARFFDGASGMLSFELAGGLEAAQRLIERVQIPLIAPSLGGLETLITRPAGTSHSGLTPEERERIGITDGLVRMSVGIESADELVHDLAVGLEA
jgi:cystathionine beta-lyase/cystathionine gamma-synthase